MSPNGNSVPAVRHHVFALLTAALMMTGCWCFLRLPHGRLGLVTFCFLSASVLYELPSLSARIRLLSVMAGSALLLQFWICICRADRILLVLLPALTAAMILRRLPHAAAWPACIAGFLGFSEPGGFIPAADSALAVVLCGIPSVLIATALFHSPGPMPPAFYARLTPGEASGLAFLLGLGIWIAEVLQMPQGVWIMLTMLFIGQFAGPDGDLFRASFDRIAATPLGLLLGGVFMACFSGFDYRFVYLLIPLGALAFYLLWRTGSFFLFTVWFMAAFSIYADWATGDWRRFHFCGLLFWRSAATLTGAGLMLGFRGFFRSGRKAA
ncbi:MAG: hypothetical protein IJS14_06875 [Lentisphaeria bacterium]|nr:hypothetical protein [Lentisphaeria bacterium]